MTDGIVKVKPPKRNEMFPSGEHSVLLSSESEIKVHYEDKSPEKSPEKSLEKSPEKSPEKSLEKSTQRTSRDPFAEQCEEFWIKCEPLRKLTDYTISVFQKEQKIVVPLRILKGIIECFCMTRHVDIKIENIENDFCGFKYKISNLKRVVSIFVERNGLMKNLKYDLSDEYNRLSTLKISLKTVY